jgi:hypothetical protein
MAIVRRCDDRCHEAKHKNCTCWCGGALHGADGADNRAAIVNALTENERLRHLKAHGFKSGETKFIQQTRLPILDGVKGEVNTQHGKH